MQPSNNQNRIFKQLLATLLTATLYGCQGSSGSGDDSAAATTASTTTIINTMEALREKLYFDESLSSPAGQSCASCHLPTAGFADPDSQLPVSEGVIAGRFGSRNSPTASYASTIPDFFFDTGDNRYEGGQFWDGSADTLEDQAQGPFVNPLEMNNTKQGVIEAIRASSYADEFIAVFGEGSLDDVDSAYLLVAEAIADFERSDFFSPFSSKFDAVRGGSDVFTPAEQQGFNLFIGKADCARCHSVTLNNPALFTDFTYRNLGVQANVNNPFYNLDPTSILTERPLSIWVWVGW